MDKLHDLKTRICSFENLLAAYKAAAESKRYRNEVLSFGLRLEENLFALQNDLLNETYEVGRYREFYVKYPKPRLVMALGFRDRIVQWAIYRQLNPYLDKRYIQHSYGCRAGKGTLAAAQCLLSWVQLVSRKPDAKDWYIVKCDVSKYFYRVSHERIMSMYAEITDDDWFLWLMDSIINNQDVPFGLPRGMSADECPRTMRLYDVGMPIGNLSSQATANMYLDRLDQHCKHHLRVHYYVRYMDDFVMVVKGKELARQLLQNAEVYLREELLLDLSPKSHIQPALQPVEFVGYLITPHGLRMRKKTTKHIKSSLQHTMEEYADGRIDLDEALARVVSYFGMTEHCSGYNLRRWIADHVVFCRGDPAEESDRRQGCYPAVRERSVSMRASERAQRACVHRQRSEDCMSNLEIIERLSSMLEQASCIIREQEALLLQHGIQTESGELEQQRQTLLEDIENYA